MKLTQTSVPSSSMDFQQKQEWEAPFPKVLLRGEKGGACKQGKLFTSLSQETNKQKELKSCFSPAHFAPLFYTKMKCIDQFQRYA